MGKIIDQVHVRCKEFLRGCQISRTVDHKGQRKGLDRAREQGKTRGCITGFSVYSRRRLRELLASARPRLECDYHVLGMCLTVPNRFGKLDDVRADQYAEVFRKMFNAWQCAFVKHFPDVGMVWRVELQRSRMPHVHIVAYVPLGDLDEFTDPSGHVFQDPGKVFDKYLPPVPLPGRRNSFKPVRFSWKHPVPSFAFDARRLWLKQLERNGLISDAALVRSVDCMVLKSDSSIHYLCDHESKRKQAQLGWQGRQWGVINRSALVTVESAPFDISKQHIGKLSKIIARLKAERQTKHTKHQGKSIKELSKTFRRLFCVDSVRSSLQPSDLSSLRLRSGDLGNLLDAPTSDTLRNFSLIEYRPILLPVWTKDFELRPFKSRTFQRPGDISLADFIRLVCDGFFDPVPDPLLAAHDALVSRLSAPLVQGVLGV